MKKLIILIILITDLSYSNDLSSMCIKEYTEMNRKESKYQELTENRWRTFGARCDYKVMKPDNSLLIGLRNMTPEYVGSLGMKENLLYQNRHGLGCLTKFRAWVKKGEWSNFGPSNHFDWWMFPISDESSQGYRYSVLDGDIEILKNNFEYLSLYREGVELMFRSWGYNIQTSKMILKPSSGQVWRGYDVRLRKVIQSLYLFDQNDYLNSSLNFVKSLEANDEIRRTSQVFSLIKKYNLDY